MSDATDRPPIALPDETRLRDEYRVGTVLGAGSFGITYRCLDEHLDTAVAIKEYYPRHIAGRAENSLNVRPHTDEDTADFENGLQQFMEEGRTVARFDHPNVVDVKSYFEENGTGYLVMDYYEGQSLDDRLSAKGGRLPEEEAVGYILDVLNGLGPVHEADVLHRDIDPQNVYLRTDGSHPGRQAILIDFGAAREALGQRSQSLSVILKPGYAPPEQYRLNGHHGPWTDVYACAATLYKCLTGLKPPVATDRVENDELVPLSEVNGEVSLETDLAIRKGLALDPERRPASADAFAELLRRSQDSDDTDGSSKATEASDKVSREGPAALSIQGPTAAEGTSTNAGLTEMSASAEERTDTRVSGSVRPPDDRSRRWSLAMLTAVGAGAVGGGVAFSDAGFRQILGFFGTWILVCGGLIGLFRQGDRLMRPESRTAISDWLLGENFAEKASGWPETFTSLFDAVFTEDHFSWTCFWRSSLVSVSIVTTGMVAVYTVTGLPSGSVDRATYLFSTIVAINLIVDYLSLYQTRWLLGQIKKTSRLSSWLIFVVVDLLATTACVLVPYTINGLFVTAGDTLSGLSVWSLDFWRLLSKEAVDYAGGMLKASIEPQPAAVIFASSFVTSVWLWLYVGAGLLLKTLRPVLDSLDWLKHLLDVERRPADAMGFLLAVLVSVGFAISAPFLL